MRSLLKSLTGIPLTSLALLLFFFAWTGPCSAKIAGAIWIAPAKVAGKPGGKPGQAHHAEGHTEGATQQSGPPVQTEKTGRPKTLAQAKQSGRPGKPGSIGGGHAGHAASSGRFESEHRPRPVRAYQIIPKQLLPEASARLLQADGTSKDLAIETCHTNLFNVKLPMDDGPMHGPNNIYVFDRQVKDNVLEVRTAKWLTIHHSCGWGHDYRNDPQRLTPQYLESAPLDIVVENLWDGNFHNALHSGDDLVVSVYSYGKPVAGAMVTITSEKGWSIEKKTDADGKAYVQLIRDYYPPIWQQFKRTQLGRLAMTAEFIEQGKSTYKGAQYNNTRYLTSFSWKYVPAGEDYNSYSYGLLVGSLGFLGSGFGIYHYRLKRRKPQKKLVFDD